MAALSLLVARGSELVNEVGSDDVATQIRAVVCRISQRGLMVDSSGIR